MGREKTRQRIAIKKAFAPKKKNSTPSTKNHRWESFSHRVARLKIDPIRRQRDIQDDRELSVLESHFRISLDKWRDLNLSSDFSRFAKQVDSLCDNLPQVLHHQDRIVELLLAAIEGATSVSAEPFLDLVAYLAQDLQVQFEKHFEKTVRTVASAAAGNQEVEVVEWCFNCLTWLFKYLERILAADICPLYDILATYLGKERQKPFVSRFAAESLSFLVKRVARKQDSIVVFVDHAFEDLYNTAREKDTELYEHSLVALFTEAIKGTPGHLHSRGDVIFSAAVEKVNALVEQGAEQADAAVRVLRNSLLILINYTTEETFAPLLESILAGFRDVSGTLLSAQLLLLATSVRNGSRVSNWSGVLKVITQHVEALTASGPFDHADVATEVLAALAVALQKCPLDVALSSACILDRICSREWQAFFPGFCSLYAEYGTDRFRSLLLPHFQRFLTYHWDGQIQPLMVLIPKLVRDGRLSSKSTRLPDGVRDLALQRVRSLRKPSDFPDPGNDEAAYLNGIFELLDSISARDDFFASVNKILHEVLALWLIEQPSPMRNFIIGGAFLHFAKIPDGRTKEGDMDLIPKLCTASSSLTDFPVYFQALSAFFQGHPEYLSSGIPEFDILKNSLLQCLTSRSHELRLSALEILSLMAGLTDGGSESPVASAIDIESTEPSLETARYISMKIRNVGMAYKSYCSNTVLADAIPRWLFGLLHVKFAQIWDDACGALKDISESKEGEQVICEVAFKWLGEAPLQDGPSKAASSSSYLVSDDYFTQFRAKVMRTISFAARAVEIQLESFEAKHQTIMHLSSMNRTQALKVLSGVPHIAEKKSRLLVPVLLSWTGVAATDIPVQSSEAESDDFMVTPTTVENNRWPRMDQKALLELFASFGNPRVLYKTDEVYATLLSLLEHGDGAIQRSALQAILSWKDKILKRYSQELFKFLDDARLREQLTVFLDSDSETSLQPEDRATVMPIVLRLIYGRIIAKSRDERRSNRKAVFVILSRFSGAEVNIFLDIIFGPLKDLRTSLNPKTDADMLEANQFGLRKQLGMLNMVKDLMDTWKTTAAPYISRLATPIVLCLLATAIHSGQKEEEISISSPTALIKAVRQTSLQCLNQCFEAGGAFDWSPSMRPIYEHIIKPRMSQFAEENAQGISALLRMFSIWSRSARLAVNLGQLEHGFLTSIYELVGLTFAKDDVKRFVINDILRPYISLGGSESSITEVIESNADHILQQVAVLMQKTQTKELVEDAVLLVQDLEPFAAVCPPTLLSAAAKLVQAPNRTVAHKTKIELLGIISHYFSSLHESLETHTEVFAAICASFGYFGDVKGRSTLVDIAKSFAKDDKSLEYVVELLDGLNAMAENRLGVPDFDRRAEAFRIINEEKSAVFSARQWRLLLGNMMFYIKDNEELAIRASASHGLRRFVEAATLKAKEEKEEMMSMMQHIVLSGIERGLKDQPDLVQIEYLSVLAHIAKTHQDWDLVSDLHHLLMGDEEASYFANILHIQQHRRVRAMKRLTEVIREGYITPRNLYRFILPLLENFIFKREDGVLAAEAARTIGVLVEWLDWQQCRAVVKRYIGFIKSKDEMQELVLKLLDAVTVGVCHSAGAKKQLATAAQDPEDNEVMEVDEQAETGLSRSMPSKEKVAQYVIHDVLPTLAGFLRDKDDSFVSRRISVAMVAAKWVQLLPDQEFQIRFPPLMTDVCNILRSKDQGSRDSTRRALAAICALVGPSAFGFILRELKSTLQRGFYLHVLSYTVHSVLESTISNFAPGDLDYCVRDIADVVIEDVFGNTGKEKDIKEYLADKTTKKEVKGKKSFDTMQLLASVTSLGRLVELVRPLQSLLAGSLNNKDVRYVDELLRRVELGVLQNQSLKDRDVLIFCYEIIQDAHKFTPTVVSKKGAHLVESAFLMRTEKKVSETGLHKSEAVGKITRFALEIVRSVLKKHKNLQTPANISGFMPIIGDALVSANEDVKLAAFRLFTAILNVPLPRIDTDAAVYIAEAARIIEDSQSNGGELEQAALKLISAVLRERKMAPVKVKERTISLLLAKMRPDFQVISQQGVAFSLLRSIISRRIIVPEVYEIMDGDSGVAAISVRDHDRTTRDLARGVYGQFLMEYPQGKGRFKKQLAFLRGNLEYEYPEGRASVMETVHLLLGKVGNELLKEVVGEVFWSLVSVMVNDENANCREMAARLVKECFERADAEWIKNFLTLARRLMLEGNSVQKRTALQCWALYLEVEEEDAEDTETVMNRIKEILEPAQPDFDDWQVVYYALHTFTTITQYSTRKAFAEPAAAIWTCIYRHLAFPHLWIKQECANLVGTLTKHLAESSNQLDMLPLVGAGGLSMDSKILCELTRKHLRLLRDGVTKELAERAVRNLAWFGKVFVESEVMWEGGSANGAHAVKEVEDEEEFRGLSDDEKDDDDDDHSDGEEQSGIAYLLGTLGGIIRREPVKHQGSMRKAESLFPKIAALQLLTLLCNTFPAQTLQESATTILAPLTHLTNPDITVPAHSTADFKTVYDELVKSATELTDLLRVKLGTTLFVAALQKVKEGQRERREERRMKRKLEVITRPEVVERRKKRKGERDKERRKEIGIEMRGKRRGW